MEMGTTENVIQCEIIQILKLKKNELVFNFR